MQQVQMAQSQIANLLVDGLDYTNVDLRNIAHAYSPTGASVKVIGGKSAGAGTLRGGKVNLFSGASSGNALSYDLSNNGRLLVRDTWYETSSPTGFVRISGGGTFTLHGDAVSLPPNQNPPAAELINFHGLASFLVSGFQDRIVTSGDRSGSNILALGLLGGENVPALLPVLTGRSTIWNSRRAVHRGSSVRTRNSANVDPQFVRQMLAQTREEQPEIIGDLPPGVSDVRFYRVSVSNAVIGVHLKP
jgi:hypothetical protein